MKATTASLVVNVWLLVAGCAEDAPQTTAAQLPSAPPENEALRVPWTLTIQNKDHQTIGVLTVRFTREKADSCIVGDWKRVVVEAFESSGEPAFPGREPLSYTVDGGWLTIGRNEVCDAYLMLGGELTADGLTGEYYSLGLAGSRPLGYVQARPVPDAMSPNTSLERKRWGGRVGDKAASSNLGARAAQLSR
jgi:hypothetical protein